MIRQRLVWAARIALSVLLLVLLFSLIDRQALFSALIAVQPGTYALAVALYLGSVALAALRWHLILRAAGLPISLRQAIGINLVGNFFSMFLPTAAGGDLARVYEVSRHIEKGAEPASTVLLDRMVGLISVVLMALVSLVVGYRYVPDRAILIGVIAVTAGLALAWRLIFSRRMLRHFRWIFRLPGIEKLEGAAGRTYTSLHALHNQPRLLVSALAVSLVVQILEILSAIVMARSFGLQARSIEFFMFLPLIWIVTMLPVSLGGIGLREGAFVLFFGQVGIGSSAAVALSLLVYSGRIVAAILGGLVFLQGSIRAPRKAARQTPSDRMGWHSYR